MEKEDRIRYKGHLSLCEIDLPGQKAICNGRVLIIGAGGLGSPVCLYLAAAGVGKIGIVDADKVSLSNLQRQIIHHTADLGQLKTKSAADKIHSLNPGVEVVTYNCFLDKDNGVEMVKDYDIVVDCTDSLCSRRSVADVCELAGKPYVFGSVSRFQGMLFTHTQGKSTYSDFFSSETEDEAEPKGCAETGILNAVVGVVGSLQAVEVLKFLSGTGDLLTDRLLVIDTLTMDVNVLDMSRSEVPGV